MNKKKGWFQDLTAGIFFVVLLAFAVASFLLDRPELAIAEAAATAVLFLFYQLRRAYQRKALAAYIQDAADNLETATRGESPLPMALVRLVDGELVWSNLQFAKATGMKDSFFEQKITSVLPNFNTDWLAGGKTVCPYDITIRDRRYRVYGTTFHEKDPSGPLLASVYLVDLTELYQVRDEYIRSRPVVAIILVDNYDELTKNLPESAISNLNAELNEVITRCTEPYQGLLRRLERNRFLFVFEVRDLKRSIEGKFPILEEIRQVVSPSGLAATLSLGIGKEAATFEEAYNFAALSIEMALSRGGDQAVIKDRYNFSFYGGRAKEADHRSKVRSRVTANSLSELVSQSSHIFVMGHKNADLDAVGAAVGICCMCRKKGKRAKIVLDLGKNASGKLLEQLMAVPEYKEAVISGQDALLLADPKSLLVVVDTNRPDQVECKPLLEAISKVCVVDHHRRAADYINPVVLNLHEPYASSASELVTELLQYSVDSSDVLPIESKALLAGIVLDTKNFNVRTGERTFEAAAFLRRLGADTVEVKKLLQNDFQSTLARYQIIKSARLYRDQIAIAALNAATSRTIAAQAADELLSIQGILASFVLYPHDDHVVISARSIGDTNVQVILEPLGGGGNAATAGAQIPNCDVKTALDRLKASIDQYYDS
ncbi:MAG: DHH family phosphoesterase [Clostridiales bacterium]|nr:DHH family phosphoesterase [Clostridiales bacterium]